MIAGVTEPTRLELTDSEQERIVPGDAVKVGPFKDVS